VNRARRLLVDYGWVAIGAGFTITNFVGRRWLVAGVWTVITGLHAGLAHRIHTERKELDHGHRRAAGSHRGRRARGSGADPHRSAAGDTDDGTPGGASPRLTVAGHGLAPGSHVVTGPNGMTFIVDVDEGGTAKTAVRASRWYETQGATTAVTNTPTRRRETTIRAYKRAGIALRHGNAALIGPVSGVRLDIDHDTAICLPAFGPAGKPRHLGATSPQVACTCGFYAVETLADVTLWPLAHTVARIGTATLEVELFGRVIRHQYGYRAEHQRILSVILDRTCMVCATAPATLVHPMAGAVMCAGCQLSGHVTTTAELANELGTEVRWAAAA
jgi:hypothetical protein